MRSAAVTLALALTVQAGAASAAEDLRFIACPTYRDADAGKKSGCWLADDPRSGQRYDVSLSPTKPDWNHAVLVEGQVKAGAEDNCGGVLLDPVRVSVLPDDCVRSMLPAEGYKGHVFVLPPRNVAPLLAPRPAPGPPYVDKTFHLVFDFDKSFVVYQLTDYLLDESIAWIRAAKPRRIVITGWAATEPASVSGQTLSERPEIARERAEKVAEAFARMGIDRKSIEVRWKTGAKPAPVAGADGLSEPSRRRVDVETFQN